MLIDIMTNGDSFDDRLFETYAENGGGPIMPRIYDDQVGQLFPVTYNLALQHVTETVGHLNNAQQEIISRTNFWPATYEYMKSFQDPRWDVAKYLPATDRFHADMSLPTLVGHLGDMFAGYHRIIGSASTSESETVEVYAEKLQEHAVRGVVIDSSISRILLAMGVRYGFQLDGPSFEEILVTYETMSARESRRISPERVSMGWSLYEEAQLRGAAKPSIDETVEFFKGVEYILQFQKTAVIMDTLGLLAKVSPALQKFAHDFYKQHKTMLFAEKPERTTQALDKLLRLFSEGIKGIEHDQISLDAVIDASLYISGRKEIGDVMLQAEMDVLQRIVDGWYNAKIDLQD